MSNAAPSIQINVNGEPHRTVVGQPLLDFLGTMNLHPSSVLVEHNGMALLREEWEQTHLADGDHLEILRVVAGG